MKNKKIEHFSISEIKNPEFLKVLSIEELKVLAQDIRNEILNVCSQKGGHLSSNLGVVELTIALHKMFDFTKDKIIFDVGHQDYTHKILTGRNLSTLRDKNGISGFQKISESTYDHYECGHSSTSISAAMGMAISRDLNSETYNVISVIGDSSFVNGLSLEAVNNLGFNKNKVIIILNDNEMSISKPIGSLSKVFTGLSANAKYINLKAKYENDLNKTSLGKTIYKLAKKFKSFIRKILISPSLLDELGIYYIGPVDGHNFKALEKALKAAKSTPKTVLVHVKTIKGKGYSFSEKDIEGKYHGIAPFKIETGEEIQNHKNEISWSKVFANLVDKNLEKNTNNILITSATAFGSELNDLAEKYTKRVIDVGIAEEHAVVMSAGLAISNKHPIVSMYSTFLQRAYDQISHDIARLNCGATFLIDRAGLVGKDGDTHQGIYDVAFLNSIPNVVITMPSNIDEANYLFEQSLKVKKPFFIRYPRSYIKDEKLYKNLTYEFGCWQYLKNNNSKIAIVSYGPLINNLLANSKTNTFDVINALYINFFSSKNIEMLLQYEKIIIYDPYSIEEGFAIPLTANLTLHGFKGEIIVRSIKKQYIKQATIEEQLKDLRLTSEDILKLV